MTDRSLPDDDHRVDPTIATELESMRRYQRRAALAITAGGTAGFVVGLLSWLSYDGALAEIDEGDLSLVAVALMGLVVGGVAMVYGAWRVWCLRP